MLCYVMLCKIIFTCIYIYGTPPPQKKKKSLPFSWAKEVYIYIYGTPPPPQRPILSQNLLVFALFCCLLLCLNVFFFWRLFYIFKKLCRVVKTLPPLIKLFSFNRKGFLQNLEKTKKPKLFGEVLVSGQKMFFFGFP